MQELESSLKAVIFRRLREWRSEQLSGTEGTEWDESWQHRFDAHEIANYVWDSVFECRGMSGDASGRAFSRSIELEIDRNDELLRFILDTLRDTFSPQDILKMEQKCRERGLFDASASDDPTAKLIFEFLKLRDAWHWSDSTSDRVTRIYKLAQVLRDRREVQFSPATKEFLRLISRCFVIGLFPECVAFCRSALDATFRDFRKGALDEICESRNYPKRYKNHGYSLETRIEAACPEFLDAERVKSAKEMKTRGDKTLHYQPHLVEDVLGTIRETIEIIEHMAHCGSGD